MNIDWVIPCRFVEVHDNLATIVGAGIDTVTVPDLPAQIGVWMAVRLTAMAEELGPESRHIVRSIVTGPGGQAISDTSGDFGAEMPGARPDWLNGLMLPSIVQFEAAEEGTYSFELIIDDSSTSTVPLHVLRASPAE